MRDLPASLKDAISELAVLDADTNEAIDRLHREAAKAWLGIETHRCRILVRVVGIGATVLSDRAAAIQGGAITLTVMPAIESQWQS